MQLGKGHCYICHQTYEQDHTCTLETVYPSECDILGCGGWYNKDISKNGLGGKVERIELTSETIRESVSKLIKKLKSNKFIHKPDSRFFTKKKLEEFAEVGFLDLTLEEIEKAGEWGFIKTYYDIDIYLDRPLLAVSKK